MRVRRLLNRMLVPLAVRRERSRTLVRGAVIREVNTHNPYADRTAAFGAEVLNLFSQIVHHSIDLLNHRLEKNLDLDPDLNSSDWSAADRVASFIMRGGAGGQFAETAVPAPCAHTNSRVLRIKNGDALFDSLDQPPRPAKREQVFVKIPRHHVPEI